MKLPTIKILPNLQGSRQRRIRYNEPQYEKEVEGY